MCFFLVGGFLRGCVGGFSVCGGLDDGDDEALIGLGSCLLDYSTARMIAEAGCVYYIGMGMGFG